MTTETQADFARRIGVARSRINALKDAGRIVMAGELVDVEASIERINATRSPAHDTQAASYREQNQPAQPPAPAQDDKIGNSYQAARAVKERYLALEAKRAYELACGQLMRADDVAAAVTDAATTLRTRLETLPDQLAASLAGRPLDEAQCRALVAEHVEHVLSDLSHRFATIAKT